MNLLPAHKNLIVTVAVLLVAAVVAYYFLVYPLRAQVNRQTAEITDLRKRLKDFPYPYPLQPNQLRELGAKWGAQRQNVQQRLEQTYDKTMFRFKDNLSAAGHETVIAFTSSVGAIDYQVKFSQLKDYLKGKDLYLDDETLGLSLHSATDKYYRYIAYLWVIRDVADLAVKHNLKLAAATKVTREDAAGNPVDVAPAQITCLPPQTYATAEDDKTEPFVEEYPVKVEVRGQLGNVSAFLQDLTRDRSFLPLTRCAIINEGADDAKVMAKFDEVRATLVCSAFLMLKEKADLLKTLGSLDTQVSRHVEPGT